MRGKVVIRGGRVTRGNLGTVEEGAINVKCEERKGMNKEKMRLKRGMYVKRKYDNCLND